MSESPPAGWLVDGRYEVLEPLGRGGFGVVWRARDLLLQRDVAVKEIRFPAVLDDAEQAQLREKVLREARAAARLNHPGVVTVYDVVEEESRAVIVMELVKAPTLAQLIERDGPLPPRKAAAIGLEVLATLTAAHDVGIVHRDVKPGNVMVEESGRVRLADFGIAVILDDPKVTTSGAIAGSPCYMAPEQAMNEAVGPASDLWSLGATLYLAVEGEPPFDKGSVIPTMTSIVQDPPRPYRRAGALGPVLDALLMKQPERRLGADGLRARLAALATSEPEEAGDETELIDTPAVVDDITLTVPREQARLVPPAPEAVSVAGAPGIDIPPSVPEQPGPVAPGGSPSPEDLSEPATVAAEPSTAAEPPTAAEPVVPAPPPPPSEPRPRVPSPTGRRPRSPRAPGGLSPWMGALLVGLVVLVVGAVLIARTGEEAPPSSSPDTASTGTAAEEPPVTGRPSSQRPTTLDSGARVPDEWVAYSDPATGFRISHPPGWEVRTQGSLTDFRDPASGAYLRVDHTSTPGPDPVQAWVDLEKRFAAMNTGYQRIQITPTRYAGFPAAIWEFTYTSGGAQLRAVDLGFVTGRYGFALNFQARARDWDRLQPVFAAFRSAFQPPPS